MKHSRSTVINDGTNFISEVLDGLSALDRVSPSACSSTIWYHRSTSLSGILNLNDKRSVALKVTCADTSSHACCRTSAKAERSSGLHMSAHTCRSSDINSSASQIEDTASRQASLSAMLSVHWRNLSLHRRKHSTTTAINISFPNTKIRGKSCMSVGVGRERTKQLMKGAVSTTSRGTRTR